MYRYCNVVLFSISVHHWLIRKAQSCFNQFCRAKPKGSNCLIFKVFWLCTAVYCCAVLFHIFVLSLIITSSWSILMTSAFDPFSTELGGGSSLVVSTAAFHARVRGSVSGLGGLKETKMFLPHPRVKLSIVGSLCDREVACSASDRQGSYFESCVWRTVSSHSSHHPQEVLLAQFSLYVHKSGLKPDSFHYISVLNSC